MLAEVSALAWKWSSGGCWSQEKQFPSCPTGKVTAATRCIQDGYYPVHTGYYPIHTDTHRATISSFFPLPPAVLSAVPRHSAASAEVFTQTQTWKPQLRLHPRVTSPQFHAVSVVPSMLQMGRVGELFKLK